MTTPRSLQVNTTEAAAQEIGQSPMTISIKPMTISIKPRPEDLGLMLIVMARFAANFYAGRFLPMGTPLPAAISIPSRG